MHAPTQVSPLSTSREDLLRRGALTRQDLALAIFERCGGMSRREAKKIIDAVIDEFVAVLIEGETLKLHGFGSFVVRDKRERSGRNPRTGAPVPIDGRRVVVFKASPNMKEAISAGEVVRRPRKKRVAKLAAPRSDVPVG
jgi:integration host factor subunit alpha